MYALTHLLFGWLIAHGTLLEKRDRFLAVFVAMAPDLDALGWVIDQSLFDSFHHEFFHSIAFCLAISIVAAIFAQERWRAFGAFLLASASHLAGDFFGTNWGMPFFWPASDVYFSSTSFLSDFAIYGLINPIGAVLVVVGAILVMKEYRRTPWEFISAKYDRRFVNFFLFPFEERCHVCGARAFFLDEKLKEPICPRHADWEKGDFIVTTGMGDES